MFCICVSNLSNNRTLALTVATSSKGDSPSQSGNKPPKLPVPTTKIPTKPRKRRQPRPPQPTVIQIERIIGAGSFRDGESGGQERIKTVFDMFLPESSRGNWEGPVEKQLRETGEWLVTNAEDEFRSSGKRILIFTFQWILPIWILSLLVAAGVIKLPFTTPFLDDLIM